MPSDIQKLVSEFVKTKNIATESADKIIAENEGKNADRLSSNCPSADSGNNINHVFDPKTHELDIDGKPRLTKTGEFRRKRGRPSGQPIGVSKGNTQFTPNRVGAKEAGLAMASTIFVICRGIFGEDWRPIIDEKQGINEPQSLAEAWGLYFDQAGITNIPPWVGLLIANAAYAMPRIANSTQTKSRLKKWYDLIKGKLAKKGNENVT